MATVSKDGLMHGKINGMVYYVVDGKQRVRGAEKKHKARKEESGTGAQCGRFGMMSKVAGWLLPVICAEEEDIPSQYVHEAEQGAVCRREGGL